MNTYNKFIVALLTAFVTAASLGLLPTPYDQWVPVIVAFAGALGVYAIPNAGKPPTDQ